MEKRHFAVAVIGGGPAGASCALRLLKQGVQNVALVDRARFPRDKSCGDGIGPGAVQLMEKLGLSEALKNHTPIRYLSVSGPSGVRAKGPLPKVGGSTPVGYTIPRLTFDNYIAQAALAAGACDLTGYLLEDAVFDGHWTLTLKENGTGQRITHTAGVVIGADGARSKVRRALNVPPNSDRHTGTAVRIYAEASQSNFDSLQIDFEKTLLPGYGWLFPIDQKRANIGVGIDLDNYKKGKHHLQHLLESYKQALGGSVEYDDKSYNAYILPYGSEMPRLAHPSKLAALVGDAGSMVNPLTGEGIFYGMFAGDLLGHHLAPALAADSRREIEKALLLYERRFRIRFQAHYELNWTMKEKVEIPIWCNMVINACRKDRVVLGDLIDLMMGDKKDIQFETMLRIVSRNLLPFLN